MKKEKNNKRALVFWLTLLLILPTFVNAESFSWAVIGKGIESYKVIETIVAANHDGAGGPHLSGNDACTSEKADHKGPWNGNNCPGIPSPGKVYDGCVRVRGAVAGGHSGCIDHGEEPCGFRFGDGRHARPLLVVDCYNVEEEAREGQDSGIGNVLLEDKEKNIGGFDALPEPEKEGNITDVFYTLIDDRNNVITYFSDTGTDTTADPSAFVMACIDANSNNVCDYTESICLEGYGAFYGGGHYADGDVNSFVCECGEEGTQGECDFGEKGCWVEITNRCCGDDANEYYNYRRGGIVDTRDGNCCDSDKDCIYNYACFDEGAHELAGEARYCNNGAWGGVAELKYDWDNKVSGYCGSNTQCLTAQSGCVDSGEFVLDNFCEDGGWTSRTKLIALQLLDIAEQISKEDYTLFCDEYENALNYYQYLVSGVPVIEHLKEVNNFCVLKLPEQVIFGASLNTPINEGRFIHALTGVNDCNNAVGVSDGKFHQCNMGSARAWYNKKIESVIYSNKNILNNPSEFEINAWEAFLTFLRNPFQIIFGFLFDFLEEKEGFSPHDYEFMRHIEDFSRIYLDRKNIRSIQGITEKVTRRKGEFLSVTYGMYADDICSTVNRAFDRLKPGQKDLVVCYYDAKQRAYHVVSNASAALGLWPDLTAKLRTRMPVVLPLQYCEAKESCDAGENSILSLSDTIDAHASKEGIGNFNYKLCCPDDYELDSSCLQEEIVRLSSEEDAHASAPDIDLFEEQVCIKAEDASKVASCESVLYPGGCYPDEICVVSLSDIGDAHVSSCENTYFKVRVCCKVEEPVCGDGKIQNGEECDSGILNGGDFCSEECKFLGEKNVPVVCQLLSGIAANDHLCRVWFGSFSGSCTLGEGQNQCTTGLLLPMNGNENHYKPYLKGTLEGGQMAVNAYNGVNYFVNFELVEPTICTDSDGGRDYYAKGVVKQYVNGELVQTPYEDYCMHPVYCEVVAYNKSGVFSVTVDECLNIVPSDTIVVGSCYICGHDEVSSCEGSECFVDERYCDGLKERDIEFRCPNGCQDGACIQKKAMPASCLEFNNTLTKAWHTRCADAKYNPNFDVVGNNSKEGADCFIDDWDLEAFSNAWHSHCGDSNYNPNFDVVGKNLVEGADCYIDVWDQMVFSEAWHTRCADPNYDPRVDVVGKNLVEGADCYIDVWDLMAFAEHVYDESWCSEKMS